MQFLFGLDFTAYEWRSALPAFWKNNPSRPGVMHYAETLIEGVVNNQAAIDEAIAGALENWDPARVGRVEQNVLRIAVYEMRIRDDVPAGAAINEAIEVAKRFGNEEAPRFVNGVLDRINKTRT